MSLGTNTIDAPEKLDTSVRDFLGRTTLGFVRSHLLKRNQGTGRGFWTVTYFSQEELRARTRDYQAVREAHFGEWRWVSQESIWNKRLVDDAVLTKMQTLNVERDLLFAWTVQWPLPKVALESNKSSRVQDCQWRMATLDFTRAKNDLREKFDVDVTQVQTKEEQQTEEELNAIMARQTIAKLHINSPTASRSCAVCGSRESIPLPAEEKQEGSEKMVDSSPVDACSGKLLHKTKGNAQTDEGEPPLPLRTCGGCRVTAYCCREHQKAHWNRGGHKHDCRTLKQLVSELRKSESLS